MKSEGGMSGVCDNGGYWVWGVGCGPGQLTSTSSVSSCAYSHCYNRHSKVPQEPLLHQQTLPMDGRPCMLFIAYHFCSIHCIPLLSQGFSSLDTLSTVSRGPKNPLPTKCIAPFHAMPTIPRHPKNFYPFTAGFPEEAGAGDGVGFNVNVPWHVKGAGDADYRVSCVRRAK